MVPEATELPRAENGSYNYKIVHILNINKRKLWLLPRQNKVPSGSFPIRNIVQIGSGAHSTSCQCQMGDDLREGEMRLVREAYYSQKLTFSTDIKNK
jgi:hypothetical protein